MLQYFTDILFIYLLAIGKNTVYKLMWWLYKVRYDTVYYYDVVVYLLFIYLFIYLLAIRKNTVYKLMWWLYKVRYDTVYYYDVVVYSSSDVTSGALQV